MAAFSAAPQTNPMNSNPIAAHIEHTLLKPEATAHDIASLCQEARALGVYGVCVNGSRVAQAAALLEDTTIQVVAVAGFPLGAMSSDVKRFETEAAIDDGAHEIDVVLNIGRLREGDHRYVLRELRDVVEAADERVVKVILEVHLLTPEQREAACHIVLDSGAAFVKTAAGFGGPPVSSEDVAALRQAVGPRFGVKAAGGIRTLAAARAMLAAGATRLGASATAAILAEAKTQIDPR
jgi:deoxyribose-phosphate aldolase